MKAIQLALATLLTAVSFTANATPPPLPPPALITFDDLTAPTTGVAVANGYANLNWNNINVYDAAHYTTPSGYIPGFVSANNAVYNSFGNPATVSSPTPFNLGSAYLTAAWNDGLQVTVLGYVNAVLTYSNYCVLTTANPTLVNFNFNGVTSVTFSAAGGIHHAGFTGSGTHFVIDNISTVTGPTIAITTPADGSWFSNAMLNVTGTASLDATQILYGVNGGQITNVATGTTNWTFPFLRSGITNVVSVRAQGPNGISAPVSRTFVYSGPQRVTVNIVGSGNVGPAFTLANNLTVGRTYTLNASPANSAWLFLNWSNQATHAVSAAPVLSFTMLPGLHITATFVTNRFLPVAGLYSGLATDNAAPNHLHSGYFEFNLGPLGYFDGKFFLGGQSYLVNGRFDPNGNAHLVIPPAQPGQPTYVADMFVNLGTPNDTVSGTLSDSDNTFASTIRGDRNTFSTATNPCPLAGQYTFYLNSGSDGSTSPGGYSFASIVVGTDGLIRFLGKSSDLNVVSHATHVSKNLQWPVFALLYQGNGCWYGWANFSGRFIGNANLQFNTTLNGSVTWIKPVGSPQGPGLLAVNLAGYYPAGFTNTTTLIGSPYVQQTPIVNYTNCEAIIRDGSLPTPITNTVVFYNNNIVSTGIGGFTLNVYPLNATLAGNFTHPITTVGTPIHGIIVQNENVIRGFHLDDTRSGKFLLQEHYVAPPIVPDLLQFDTAPETTVISNPENEY